MTKKYFTNSVKMILLIAGSFFAWMSGYSQTPTRPDALPANKQQSQDTTTTIVIDFARSLRTITLADGTELQTLAGNAAISQGNTKLTGDSIVLNSRTGVAEVFGNVHINDADTVNTYANYLRYLGKERMAYLKKNVKLTDGKGTLLTEDLEYNLATGIATYKGGGRVINGKTVLTSSDAVYYSNTKDVYFKKYVQLTDPNYDIKADSLLYNTLYKTATFISPTRIKTKEGGIINTRSGTYNLDTRDAIFYDRTSYSDSTRSATGEKMAYDEKSGLLQIEGRGKLVDSANKVIALGGQILLDKFKNSFLATRKPVMILYNDNDSTYVAADTLFSGLEKYDSTKKKQLIREDTLTNVTAISISSPNDSLKLPAKKDSTSKINKQDSRRLAITDSAQTAAKPDSIRYFLAFHNVRIYNDSLQAVSDSLFYSTEDSVFRLFRDPVAWNGQSQVSGDTMYLFTKNQKPERLYVFNNSIVINETREKLYNQMAGRTLNAYFVDGNIDSIRVKGSPAESVYYMQDEDSSYIGMNRSSGDVIDIFFKNKELNKVKFINDVNGNLYPMKQVPPGENRLKGFNWMDKRRPKTALALFE